MGRTGFLCFYLLSGLAAGFLHIFFNASSRVPTVGASGAIAGVMGAYLLLFPYARCPFRKSCASIFWARQRVNSWACSPHVALSLLHDKDIDHARAYCVPGLPGS
jgi:membrane associated rhomboid family serine protease